MGLPEFSSTSDLWNPSYMMSKLSPVLSGCAPRLAIATCQRDALTQQSLEPAGAHLTPTKKVNYRPMKGRQFTLVGLTGFEPATP